VYDGVTRLDFSLGRTISLLHPSLHVRVASLGVKNLYGGLLNLNHLVRTLTTWLSIESCDFLCSWCQARGLASLCRSK